MKKFLILLALIANPLQAADVDLTEALKRRNELFIATQEVRPYLYDEKVLDRLSAWVHQDKIRPYIVDCQFQMRPFFRTEKIIGPLCYLLRQSEQTRRATAKLFVRRYILEMGAALAELADDPQYSADDRGRAKTWVRLFTQQNEDDALTCLQFAMPVTYPADGSLPFTPFSRISDCFHQLPKINGSPYFAVNLVKEFPYHPGHVISEAGWVPGNQITYTTLSDTSGELAQKLADRHPQMREKYPLDGAGSLAAMKQRDPATVFTPTEGFWPFDEHPVWTEAEGIFPTIAKAVKEARESIFIDVFFIGSSTGAALAKLLVEKAEAGVKVFVLKDNVNHFGHEKEMRPVFNFLQAYSYRNPKKMLAVSSYIKAHRTGLPKIFDRVVSDEFLYRSGIQAHLKLYGRAQSDHSKVFVVDGLSRAPVAIVGSKNLTDASGALCHDDVTRIEGPAAAVVLDDYYADMAYGLRYEEDAAYVAHMAKNGWSSDRWRNGMSREEQVAAILAPFDLLKRDANMRPGAGVSVKVPEAGQMSMRLGSNNVDSSRTSCIDQVIQMIKSARRNIFIRDQFLFERNIVLALIAAKEARPSLDIRAVLERQVQPQGLPNSLYLDLLKRAGIGIRIKRAGEDRGPIKVEYHMKTISADGTFLIAGSANKDQTTMYGAFREAQVDVADASVTSAHDEAFERQWGNDQSEEWVAHNFAVPAGLKGPDGQVLTPTRYIGLLRNMISLLFDATTL